MSESWRKAEFIARISHLVWCGYQMGAGLPFEEMPRDAARRSQERAARKFLANPNMTPEENHENWMADRCAHGWVWGEVKDEVSKTHPDLVPYAELSEVERRKDEMDLMARSQASFIYDLLFRPWGEADPAATDFLADFFRDRDQLLAVLQEIASYDGQWSTSSSELARWALNGMPEPHPPSIAFEVRRVRATLAQPTDAGGA